MLDSISSNVTSRPTLKLQLRLRDVREGRVRLLLLLLFLNEIDIELAGTIREEK